MDFKVLCVSVFVFVSSTQCYVIQDSTPPPVEQNGECYREDNRIWTCKKENECSSKNPTPEDGGTPSECAWNNPYEPMVCCPPPVSQREDRSLTGPESGVSQKMCSQYQAAMCKNRNPRVGALTLMARDTTPSPEPTTEMTFDQYVTGGKPASPMSHPHAALIGYGEENAIEWQCGGSLVSETYVVSAAHCSNTEKFGMARWVRVGVIHKNSTDPTAQTFRIKERILHGEYSAPAYYNDIVLFLLDGIVKFNDFVRPACLYNSKKHIEGRGIVAGWGRSAPMKSESHALLEATIRFVPAEECKTEVGVIDKYLSDGIEGDIMVCAGEPGKDACQGDSGGPLILEATGGSCLATLVGVTSFGSRFCGMMKTPGVFVKVAQFVPWIESVVWPTQ